jgi:1-acyl-sn-glycerol-3-phosphate acyltransferase
MTKSNGGTSLCRPTNSAVEGDNDETRQARASGDIAEAARTCRKLRHSFVIRHSSVGISERFHAAANRLSALFMKVLFGSVARVHVLRLEQADRGGGFLLASNHISHFDPLIISGVVRRKIEWMTMAEFFSIPVLRHWLCAVDAFPADRDRANRITIRTAIERLRAGRVIGLFPEGGIRDGKNSMLEGGTNRSGVAALSHLANVPVLPCVIFGSDRLYNKKRWLPLRRTHIWIGFGEPIKVNGALDKAAARRQIEQEFTTALVAVAEQLRDTFHLTAEDLPRPPRARMQE